MTRFWSLVADLGSWLLNTAIDNGAYQEMADEDAVDQATLDAIERDEAIYQSGVGDGYLEGLHDAARLNSTGSRFDA